MSYSIEKLNEVLPILDECLEKGETAIKINDFLKKMHKKIVKYVECDTQKCEEVIKDFKKIKKNIKNKNIENETVLDIIELYKNKVELLRFEIKDSWHRVLSNIRPYEGD